MFWNVTGLLGKDKKFFERLERWDVITLLETWVDDKGWQKTKKRLPGGYIWRMQGAKRRSKKGRAMGEMMLGVRKEL